MERFSARAQVFFSLVGYGSSKTREKQEMATVSTWNGHIDPQLKNQSPSTMTTTLGRLSLCNRLSAAVSERFLTTEPRGPIGL